jgi:hypothetical protein
MEPITREQLQNLKAEADHAAKLRQTAEYVRQYYETIKNTATTQNVTSRFINTMGHAANFADDAVIELRKLFPNCIVDRRETKTMNNRVIESGIIVDWS